ncbi:MAG: MOSC domain-containing protein [Gammaproteobacteria bacterium]|nr:MOSC domain-containing protein [Gammaproteobacteria bacterium]MDD9894619.1 MOSC domain-containing protein [Gammaproteobacteria bacterium]MDD9960073.1 MOSC domain-containing protein [Gammaproteobacteria bacterium]
MGSIEAIYIATEKRQPVQPLALASLEAGKGIVGDRYHQMAGNMLAKGKSAPLNHITFIAKEELDAFFKRHNTDLNYGDFRRNVITSGIDLNALVDKEFRVGSARCKGFELCEPCQTLSRTVYGAVLPELINRAGLRAIILEDGEIKPGDTIEKV